MTDNRIYVPSEIWGMISDQLNSTKHCLKCDQDYCTNSLCLKKSDHICCVVCNELLCLNTGDEARQCQKCIGLLCKNCITHTLATHNNTTYHRYGCKDCVQTMENDIHTGRLSY